MTIEHFAGRATTAEQMDIATKLEKWLANVLPQEVSACAKKFNVTTAYMTEVVRLLIAHNRAHMVLSHQNKRVKLGPPPNVTIGPRPFKELQYDRKMLAALERSGAVYQGMEWKTL